MPKIIPIKDLKNTAEISEMCHESKEPIFVTKNGYGDMVIMSMEHYEQRMFMEDVYRMLEEGEKSIAEGRYMSVDEAYKRLKESIAEGKKDVEEGRVTDAHEFLAELKEKYK